MQCRFYEIDHNYIVVYTIIWKIISKCTLYEYYIALYVPKSNEKLRDRFEYFLRTGTKLV